MDGNQANGGRNGILQVARSALAAMPDGDFAAAYAQIMQAARQHGLHGFGGECWAVAVAINQVIFGGTGTVIAGLNNPLFEAAGITVGHAAVSARGACWDADGRPKEENEVESWGMLDCGDSDRRAVFEDAGLELTEGSAADAGIWNFRDEEKFSEAAGVGSGQAAAADRILMTSLLQWCRQGNPGIGEVCARCPR